jgi:hypothetical protein
VGDSYLDIEDERHIVDIYIGLDLDASFVRRRRGTNKSSSPGYSDFLYANI